MTLLVYALVLSFGHAEPGGLYSWEDCIRLAKQNNAEVLSARKTLLSNEYLESNAKGYFLPELTYNLSATRSDEDLDGISTTTPINSEIRTAYNGSIEATQNIFSGFRDFGRVKQAQANRRAAESVLQITKARISYDLKSTFQSVIYAKEYSRLTQDIIRRRKDNMSLVDLRYRSGRENKGSLLLAQAYYSQSKLDDLQAHNAEKTARAQLAKALGFDEDQSFDIKGAIPTHAAPEKVNLQEMALNTPEYKQSQSQWEAAQSGTTISRSRFLPSLDLSAGYSQSGYHMYPDDRDQWTVRLNLSYPIFSGFKDYTSLRSSSALAAAAQANFSTVARQQLARLTSLYSQYQEAILKFEVDKDFRAAAEVRANIARSKYNNGLLSFDDWDVIESDLIARQKSYLQSERDRTIAEAAWEQGLGVGVIE
jgi:outer membrane protein TolC